MRPSVSRAVVLALHDEQLAEHGGGDGLRDEGLLESALDRPRNLIAYGTPDMADLAAAYAYGIARNHPFVDGNKRAAFVVTELFLGLNGLELSISDAAVVAVWTALAAGELTEEELARTIRAALRQLST